MSDVVALFIAMLAFTAFGRTREAYACLAMFVFILLRWGWQ
jgi:uncharacterized membrane protein YgaE (UPF0421/DUF939 family)